jgi:hypothetical protein
MAIIKNRSSIIDPGFKKSNKSIIDPLFKTSFNRGFEHFDNMCTTNVLKYIVIIVIIYILFKKYNEKN